ncbi:MAG: phospho-N-acetylmuramoyl-pentapeptide-transferase, partial [Lentisphaeria bacterium]
MLYFLSHLANYQDSLPFLGPFRLFSSHLTLMGLGLVLSAILTWILIPKLKHLLPTDRGKNFACEGAKSKGKPQAAGIIFISIFALVCFLVLPPNDPNFRALQAVICIYFTMITGFLDDVAKKPWGQLTKGL